MQPLTFSQLGQNGRLGNQLFQIAATIGIAEWLKTKAIFPEWIDTETGRDMQMFFKNKLEHPLASQSPASSLAISAVYDEPAFHYTPVDPADFYNVGAGGDQGLVDLKGYFQSEKYWAHCKEKILKQFEFSDAITKKCSEIIKQVHNGFGYGNNTLTSVHFRFGDYVNNPYYVNLVEDGYYERAFRRNYYTAGPISNTIYLVFSDNKAAAAQVIENFKKKFGSFQYLIIENNTDVEDLCLMSLCDNNICANSSFSWWGQALASTQVGRQVIFPKNWFGPSAGHDTKDLYPSPAETLVKEGVSHLTSQISIL